MNAICMFGFQSIKRDDGKVRLILPPWASQLNGFSPLFEAFVIKFCKHMLVHHVCQLMDETAKGPDYITLFVDLYKKAVAHIGDGKSSQTVVDFVAVLEQQKGNKEHVKSVSCAMSPAFIKGIKENLPNAQITFDKFHIIKIINEGVDKVRRAEV